jgi:hypothetical protein
MQSRKKALILGVLIFMIGSVACSFTTANLSSLKLSKDEAGTQQASSFGADETVYGIAGVSNAPGKVKIKGRLLVEDVPGEKTGPIPGLETSVDLPGSGTATFTFTPPPTGWPKGKYKLEAVMLDEKGDQKDQKSADFSIQ